MDVTSQRITFAPQFHENHVFAGTFLLNILIGREWPAATDDIPLTDDGAKHSVRVVLGERRQAPDAERAADGGRAALLKE